MPVIKQTHFFYDDNDHLLRLVGLQNSTGSYVNNATLSAQVVDLSGASVGSPIVMNYVAASNGVYEGNVPFDLAVTVGDRYHARITVTAPIRGKFMAEFVAVERTNV